MRTALTRSADKPPPQPAHSGAGEALHPLAHLRAAGNQAMQRVMSGAPLPRELRSSLESYFRTPLDRVRIHTDATSQALADTLGARAFTVGQNIHLGTDGTIATGSERNELLAHEVVHTLQQGQVGPRAKLKVGAPDDHYEKQADRISASFARGDAAEAVDHVGAPVIQRAMHQVHYGHFEDFQYLDLTDNNGTPIGVAMYLKFHPGTEVRADSIGLTQAAMGTIRGATITRGVLGLHQATSGAGIGRFIDRLPGQPNPLYGTTETVSPGGDPANLADYPSRTITPLTPAQQAAAAVQTGAQGIQFTGGSQKGFRKVVNGAFVSQSADLYDAAMIGAPVPSSGQVFETTALALEGPQRGTYYGSVKWGWLTDAAGAFTRIPFDIVSQGVPSVDFLTAATIWNPSRVDFAYETTAAANLLARQAPAGGSPAMVPMVPPVTIPINTQVTPGRLPATAGGTPYLEVTYNGTTGFVDSTQVRPIAVGAETVDLPVPIVHTVTNPAGSTMVLSTAATALAPNTLLVPRGTRITTTRCMAPTAALPNHYEGTVADSPAAALVGTRGYFFVPDLTLERVGTR
jgi:hypothetical protein